MQPSNSTLAREAILLVDPRVKTTSTMNGGDEDAHSREEAQRFSSPASSEILTAM